MRPPTVFFVTGEPIGQPRPRAIHKGGHTWVYDPPTANAWKSIIRAAWKAEQEPAWEGPLSVSLRFAMPRPKAHFGTGKNAGKLKPDAPFWYEAKPDRDNLDKAVLDALTNAGAWPDDAHACAGYILKTYANPGQETGVLIRIAAASENFDIETK